MRIPVQMRFTQLEEHTNAPHMRITEITKEHRPLLVRLRWLGVDPQPCSPPRFNNHINARVRTHTHTRARARASPFWCTNRSRVLPIIEVDLTTRPYFIAEWG